MDKPATYRIVRFFYNPRWLGDAEGRRERRVIKTKLTLEDAQEHCNNPRTKGKDWFDGYEQE